MYIENGLYPLFIKRAAIPSKTLQSIKPVETDKRQCFHVFYKRYFKLHIYEIKLKCILIFKRLQKVQVPQRLFETASIEIHH